MKKKHPELIPPDDSDIDKKGEIIPYLDKNNKYFSKELSIAIETWLAMYGPDGSLNPSQKHRKQIIVYLNKNYSKLFPDKCDLKKYWTYNQKGKLERKLPAKVDRIVTMVNCDADGGAEKIGD